MLLGQMPGDARTGSSTLFAALPSYATLVGRYLDRFGPYRLQPYALPAMPQLGMPSSAPSGVLSSAAQTVAAPRVSAAAGGRETRSRDPHAVRDPFDPVGAGLGVLTDLDRVIGASDLVADPLRTGLGFSNPGVLGLGGLVVRELAELERRRRVDAINDARRKGFINDANRRVGLGAATRRAGGVGTPGVGGGFTTRRIDPESRRAGGAGHAAEPGTSDRGPGSRGRGFDHYGGPR